MLPFEKRVVGQRICRADVRRVVNRKEVVVSLRRWASKSGGGRRGEVRRNIRRQRNMCSTTKLQVLIVSRCR